MRYRVVLLRTCLFCVPLVKEPPWMLKGSECHVGWRGMQGARGQRLSQSAILIQAAYRGMEARTLLRTARAAAIRIQVRRVLPLESLRPCTCGALCSPALTAEQAWFFGVVQVEFGHCLAPSRSTTSSLLQSFAAFQTPHAGHMARPPGPQVCHCSAPAAGGHACPGSLPHARSKAALCAPQAVSRETACQ